MVFVAVVEGQVIGYSSLVAGHRQVLLALAGKYPVLVGRFAVRGFLLPKLLRYLWKVFAREYLGAKWPKNIEPYKEAYELRSVAVDANYRGMAIGTTLLDATLAYAGQKGWKSIIAWVAEDNLASSRLFEKVGFQKVSPKDEAEPSANLYVWKGEWDVLPEVFLDFES